MVAQHLMEEEHFQGFGDVGAFGGVFGQSEREKRYVPAMFQ